MIEINFFEKKKKNILPYTVVGIFLLSILLLGTYFFITYTKQENLIEEKNQWLTDNTEDIALSREISQVDQLTIQSVSVQETLRSKQYPMDTLTKELMSFIPNEAEHVSSFQLSESSNQVSLIIENINTTGIQSIIEELEKQTYIEDIELLRAEDQNQEDKKFRFELFINLNLDNYAEEEVE